MALPRFFNKDDSTFKEPLFNQLQDWYQTELGGELLKKQQQILEELLPSRYGQILVFSGVMAHELGLNRSEVARHLFLANPNQRQTHLPSGEVDRPTMMVQTSLQELPFATETVDVMLLHHSLDIEDNVHAALREISRVVTPGGSMIIIGFNPWSLWGMLRLLRRPMRRKSPWSSRFMSPFRVTDWLKLLDFELEGCEYSFYLPPFSRANWLHRMAAWHNLADQSLNAFGACYVLVAKKQRSCMTPIKPVWQRPQFVPLPMARMVSRTTKGAL